MVFLTELDRLMIELEDFYTTPANFEATRLSFESRERCNIYGEQLNMSTLRAL